MAGGLGKGLDYSFSADQFHTVGEYQNDFYRNTAGVADSDFVFRRRRSCAGFFADPIRRSVLRAKLDMDSMISASI